MRPDCEPQIEHDHFAFGQRVVESGHAQRIPDAPLPQAEHQASQHHPGRGQRQIKWPPLTPGIAECPGDKRAIIEEHHERCRHHDLLAGHAEETGREGAGQPAAGVCFGPADKTIQGEEVAQPHERFGALREIVHHLGLQRMDGPEHRHGQGQRPRGRLETLAQDGEQEGAPDEAKQGARREEMNREIKRVVTPHGRPAHRVVERESEVGERPADHPASFRWRRQDRPERPEMTDGRIFGDRALIVEDQCA